MFEGRKVGVVERLHHLLDVGGWGKAVMAGQAGSDGRILVIVYVQRVSCGRFLDFRGVRHLRVCVFQTAASESSGVPGSGDFCRGSLYSYVSQSLQ